MRYAIASDIHGSATWCSRLLEDVREQRVDRLVLLGDLMYHGPRNPLPDGYDPAEVARMLNDVKDRVIAVRGNCDSEVDQMLLDFPMMGDYAIVMDDGEQILCTHGHLEGPMPDGSVVMSGHTHVKRDETVDGVRYLNPGSVGLPKDGSHSYMVYEDGDVEFREL